MAVPARVQHVSTSNSYGGIITNTTGVFRLRMKPTQAGNLLVCAFQSGPSTGMTFTVTDDKGNTWTQGPTGVDSTNAQVCFIFYFPNSTAGTQVVQIKNTTGVDANFFSAMVTEFCNIATTTPGDGSNGASGSSTSVAAGNITPGTSGDLIYQAGFRDTTVSAGGAWAAGSQANITWKLESADMQDGSACQWGQYNSTATISPTFSMTNTGGWLTVAMAFKNATAGVALSATDIDIASIIHISMPGSATSMSGVTGISNPMTIQINGSGNLLVCSFSSGSSSFLITGITDTSGQPWEQSGSGVSNGTQDSAQIWYSANRTVTGLVTLTVTFNGIAIGDATALFYDVVNAATVQNDLERTGSATGDQTVGAATITGAGTTPTTINGLVFMIIQQEFNTENAITSPAGAVFNSIEFDGMGIDGPQNMDQNGGWAYLKNVDLSPITTIWGLINTSTDPMRQWASYIACFKSPQGATMGNVWPPKRGSMTRPAPFKPGIGR